MRLPIHTNQNPACDLAAVAKVHCMPAVILPSAVCRLCPCGVSTLPSSGNTLSPPPLEHVRRGHLAGMLPSCWTMAASGRQHRGATAQNRPSPRLHCSLLPQDMARCQASVTCPQVLSCLGCDAP